MTQTPVPIYEDLASEVEEFYQKISSQELDDFQPIRNCTQKLLEAVQKEGADLFELACHPFEDKPMARHVVHAAILSVMLGQSLKLNPEKLLGLAETALLFDVGMTALRGKELKDIRKHPEHGAKELTKFPDCPPEVLQAVAQHHERFDGSGYPKGLKEDQI
ncbi:MAG: HD domain-containing protein, partial [Deltaproteobacteria bacterium]|nr:HD domain-containing protein [Deltaproteobacteria bacterium]